MKKMILLFVAGFLFTMCNEDTLKNAESVVNQVDSLKTEIEAGVSTADSVLADIMSSDSSADSVLTDMLTNDPTVPESFDVDVESKEVVKELQRRLDAAGFDIGPSGVDGIYGPYTRAAHKEYKKSLTDKEDFK